MKRGRTGYTRAEAGENFTGSAPISPRARLTHLCCRAIVSLCLLALPMMEASVSHAAEPSVGMVTRVQSEASVVSAGATQTARVGTVLHLNDELRTGAGGRLQVTFRDNTLLTLGESAVVVIDRYVFDPDAETGEATLNATRGALRFLSGRISSQRNADVTVSTPLAQVGVRGTEFWAGPLGQRYGVLLLKPKVTVSNQGGAVTLVSRGQGTDIVSLSTPPSRPTIWSPDKFARRWQARISVSFRSTNKISQRRSRAKMSSRAWNRVTPSTEATHHCLPGSRRKPSLPLSCLRITRAPPRLNLDSRRPRMPR